MKTAIVHDWLTGMRGGERVLEVICERYPDAELFTLIHVRGSVSPVIERRRIHTSPLNRVPGIHRFYRQCLPTFPTLIEQFDLDPFDLVISSSHCVAKSVVVRPGAAHVCYCHTPMRYAWDQFDAYFGRDRVGRVGRAVLAPVMARMARWDRATAGRVTRYVTNSQYVARRIARYYNRQASVVYPPVDTTFFTPDTAQPGAGDGCVIVSALVPYKRIDVAIEACRLAGVKLAVVGSGPERAPLERLAAERGAAATFFGRLSDHDVRDRYNRAAVTLMTGEEDFGIAPLEAQACGRPVVALARGGALETIVPDRTGVLVDDPSPSAFADAIRMALRRPFDRDAIRRHAERFGRVRFGDEFQAVVNATLAAESPAC